MTAIIRKRMTRFFIILALVAAASGFADAGWAWLRRSSVAHAAPTYPTTTAIQSTATTHPDGSTYMAGFPVRVNFKVSDTQPGQDPTGTVTVKENSGSPLCTAPIDSNGDGSCLLLFSVAGSKALTATYSGDSNFNPSGTTSFTNLDLTSLSPPLSLTAGRNHTCLLDTGGVLECWGDSANYLADASGVNIPLSNVVKASAGDFHTCAIKLDGSVECWGDNAAIRTEPSGPFMEVSVGRDHVCAIGLDEKLVCWGTLTGELSNFYTGQVRAVSAGNTFSCAIKKSDGQPVCWGTSYGTPPSTALARIAVGNTHTCAITTSEGGQITCWGAPALSQTGNGFIEIDSGSDYTCARNASNLITCFGGNTPAGIDQSNAYSNFATGFLHTCALKDQGGGTHSLSCWGPNTQGQAPRISITPNSMPTYIPKDRPFSRAFVAGGGASPYSFSMPSGTPPAGLSWATASVTTTLQGTPTATGTSSFTLRTAETFANSNLPLPLTVLDQPLSTTVQDATTSVALGCCGVSVPAGSPVLVAITVTKTATPNLSGTVTLTSDEPDATCTAAISSGGTGQCTLYFSTPGQKTIHAVYNGDSFYLPSSETTRNVTIDPVTIDPMIAAGDRFNCSLDASGALTCWGMNDSGQTTPPPSIFNRLSAGYSFACARALSGRIYCWGWNGYNVSTPPTDASYVQVAAGEQHACAQRFDGSVTCWGNPAGNRLAVPAMTFTQISAGQSHTCGINSLSQAACWGSGYGSPPADGLSAISAGAGFTCAIRSSDNAMLCWGSAVPTGTPVGTFKALDAGHAHACAIRSDDSLACWGDNSAGQTAAPAGTFKQVSAGKDHTCALRSDGYMLCWGGNSKGQAPVLNLSPSTLTTFDVNAAAAITLTASGGRTTQYAYSIITGAAAPGLNLDNSPSGTTATFGGTATQPGQFAFTVRAVESSYTPALLVERSFNHTVRSRVNVTISSVAPAERMVGRPTWINVAVAESPGGNFLVTPSLTVTVQSDDGNQCKATLASGVASCAIFFTSPGAKNLSASYSGDANFLPGSTTAATSITALPFEHNPTVHTGLDRTYIHRQDGTLFCVGANCTQGNLTGSYTAVDVGDALVCVLNLNGDVFCKPNLTTGYTISGPFTALSVGKEHACAIRLPASPTASGGAMQCWQANGSAASAANTPPPGAFFKALSAGAAHTCGIQGNGALACWGDPTALNGMPAGTFKALAAGDGHTCAVRSNGAIACWGENLVGESGPLPAGLFTAASAGSAHSCALNEDGGLACWGEAADGRSSAPYGPSGPAQSMHFKAVDSYADHNCALRGDPASPLLTCWGKNNSGEAPQFNFNPLLTQEIVVNQYWEHTFAPVGGTKPYLGGVVHGALPPGVNLGVYLSPAGIVLFGTPQVVGVYPFVLAWRDSQSAPLYIEQPYTLTVTGADLAVSITPPDPAVAMSQNELVLRYVVSNTSVLDVPNVQLSVNLPPELAGVTHGGLPGCTLLGSSLDCAIASFGAGSQATLVVTGVVTATPGNLITTIAEIQPLLANWPEVADADNTDSLSLPVLDRFELLNESFENEPLSPLWSAGQIITSPLGVSFLGEFTNSDWLRLTINDLPGHQRALVSFDLYVIGPWLGNSPGPGGIGLWEFGEFALSPLLSTTFCNNAACQQSFPQDYPFGSFPAGSGAAGLDELGYPGLKDARYHFYFELPHTARILDLLWASFNLPPGAKWGIDNVVIVLDASAARIFLPLISR